MRLRAECRGSTESVRSDKDEAVYVLPFSLFFSFFFEKRKKQSKHSRKEHSKKTDDKNKK